jgi:hypothetical protein
LPVLDQLLVVFILVEILHTVHISIRSHILVTEPILVVGLIASANSGHYPAGQHSHQGRKVDKRWREPVSRRHAGAWTAGPDHSGADHFDDSAAPLCARPHNGRRCGAFYLLPEKTILKRSMVEDSEVEGIEVEGSEYSSTPRFRRSDVRHEPGGAAGRGWPSLANHRRIVPGGMRKRHRQSGGRDWLGVSGGICLNLCTPLLPGLCP